jgi:periplasmic mercuric ion binding protein
MKTLKFIIVALLAILLGSNSYAQMQDHSKMDMSKTKTAPKMDMASTKTETLKVSGNCDQCKIRIEKAAKLDGVSKAEWDTKTNILSVSFDPAKTNMDLIAKKVAAAGHDNAKAKADEKAYSALPGCCKYR